MKLSKKPYTKTILDTQLEVTAIYTVHYFKYGQNFNFEKEKHNFWEMIYIDSGTATIIADKNTLFLSQGQAFIYKPNQIHTVKTNDNFANSAIISFDVNKNSLLTPIANRILKFNSEEKSTLQKIIHETKLNFSDKLNDLNLKKMTKRVSSPFGGE